MEDRGVEPLTRRCKRRVFPLALIPRAIVSPRCDFFDPLNLLRGGWGERILVALQRIAEVAKCLEVPAVIGPALEQRPDMINRQVLLASAVLAASPGLFNDVVTALPVDAESVSLGSTGCIGHTS
jgi:hypothetical protein